MNVRLLLSISASSGGLSIPQIQNFIEALKVDQSQYENSILRSRGGRRFDADTIAFGVGSLFEDLNLPITFGTMPTSDEPSTDFGKAVQFALQAFGIDSHWRNVAKRAFDLGSQG